MAGPPNALTPEGATAPPRVSRRSAAMWSLLFSYASLTLGIIRQLALIPLYLRFPDPEHPFIEFREWGAWEATGGVLAYLTIVDFGLMGVLTQRAALACGAGDLARLGRLIGTGLLIAAGLSGLAVALAAGVAPFIPHALDLGGDTATRISWCFFIVASANGLAMFAFATGGVLKSLQRPLAPGLLWVLADVLSIIVTVSLLYANFGLYSVAFGLFARGAFAAVATAIACTSYCYRRLHLRFAWARDEAKSFWTLSAYQFTTRLAATIMASSDVFLIGVLLGPTASGMYALTVRAHETVRSLSGRFGDALMPGLAHLFGEGQIVRFREVTVAALKLQVVVAAVGMAGVVAFNESFVTFWVGADRFAGRLVTTLMGIWGAGFVVGGVVAYALLAIGEIPALARVTWLEAALRLPLCVMGILSIGVAGAPVAAVAAQVVATALLFHLLIARLGFPRSDVIAVLRDCTVLIAAPIAAAAATVWLAGVPGNWSQFVLLAIVYSGVAVVLCAAFDRRLMMFVLRRGRGSLSRDAAESKT